MNKIYAYITTLDAVVLPGPWTLRNMFDLVACPVFENNRGDIVPIHYVANAQKNKES